jgi:hypothetical protein
MRLLTEKFHSSNNCPWMGNPPVLITKGKKQKASGPLTRVLNGKQLEIIEVGYCMETLLFLNIHPVELYQCDQDTSHAQAHTQRVYIRLLLV